ncbi:MAG: caspase family protein [Myxococcaceae bacterium]
MSPLLAIALALTVAGTPAPGASRRLAIVVGNSEGSGVRPSLRYAERDAARVSRALTEVGEVAGADVQLLQGKKLAEVEAAFARVRERIAELHRTSGAKAMLVFYFSGHGDGTTLELGAERLSYPRLKALLGSSGADLRLGIVDACNSSSLIEAGGKAAPGFTLQAEDRLQATGEAFITSSAADETSLESSQLSGSVFTHHLVVGLRGAADRSGDGLVSLDELYRYSYERTAASALGQHPGYGFRLAGQGELILSNLKKARTAIELPPVADLVTLIEGDGGEVLAQLDGQAARTLAIPAGRYLVRARRDGVAYSGRFALGEGVRGALGFDALRPERSVSEAPSEGGHSKWVTASLIPISGELPPSSPPVGMSVVTFTATRGDPALEALTFALTQAVSAEVGRVEGVHLFRPTGARIDARDLQKLSSLDVLSDAALGKLRGVPGAELAVVGLVSRGGDLVNASLYLVDVPTGRVLEASHGARAGGAVAGFGEELAHEAAAAVRAALERRRPR